MNRKTIWVHYSSTTLKIFASRVRPTTIILKTASTMRIWRWRKTPSSFTISFTTGTSITNCFVSLQSSIRNVYLLLQKPSAYFWLHQQLIFLIAFCYGTITCVCMTCPWGHSVAAIHKAKEHAIAETQKYIGRFWTHYSVLSLMFPSPSEALIYNTIF